MPGAAAATEKPARRNEWDGVLRREIDVELRVLDAEKRSVEVIASTEALDSHGTIVKQFWDLKRYERHGTVLWNHNIFESSPYSFGGAVRPEDNFPIGRAENVRVEGKKLKAELILGTKDYSEIAEKVFLGCQQKIITAVSVGFRPGQVTRILNKDGSTKHYELGSAENPNELREISFVPMGSNPDAVVKSAAVDLENLSRMAAPAADPASTKPKDKNMDIEQLQKQLEQAKIDLGVAQKALTDSSSQNTTLAADLAAERALTGKLTKDLEAANKSLGEAKAEGAKSKLDALQGLKFAPAEREELNSLVKDIGLERVERLLASRADLVLTEQVPGVDRSLKTPPPIEGGNAGGDIASEAMKGL